MKKDKKTIGEEDFYSVTNSDGARIMKIPRICNYYSDTKTQKIISIVTIILLLSILAFVIYDAFFAVSVVVNGIPTADCLQYENSLLSELPVKCLSSF